MKKFWQDFKKFITRGNVVDMAVGVAVASAFTAIVTAFTKGFITPLLALLSPANSDLAEMKWIIRPEVVNELADGTVEVVTAEVALLWGAFVQKIIDFFIIAFTLFIVLRIASAIAAYSAKIREQAAALIHAKELEEAAKAAEEAKIAEEAAAAEAAEKARLENEAKAAEIAAEKARLEREEALLSEIRDLLRAQAGK
jgi:large conductance mechanosensitive channel